MQRDVLRYLSRANRFSRGPLTVAAWLGQTKGTVSKTISGLKAKGLVVKESVPEDGRARRLSLTEAGRAVLADDPMLDLLPVIRSLTPDARARLGEGLEALLRSALDAQGGREFGECRTCTHFRRRAAGGDPHRCGLLDVPLSAQDSRLVCVEHERAA